MKNFATFENFENWLEEGFIYKNFWKFLVVLVVWWDVHTLIMNCILAFNLHPVSARVSEILNAEYLKYYVSKFHWSRLVQVFKSNQSDLYSTVKNVSYKSSSEPSPQHVSEKPHTRMHATSYLEPSEPHGCSITSRKAM